MWRLHEPTGLVSEFSPSVMQTGVERSLRNVEGDRKLGDAKTFEIDKDDGLPFCLRNRRQCALQKVPRFEARRMGRDAIFEAPLGCVLPQCLTTNMSAFPEVPSDVSRDCANPWSPWRLWVVCVLLLKHDDKDLLCGVLDHPVRDTEASQEAKDQWKLSFVDRPKRARYRPRTSTHPL